MINKQYNSKMNAVKRFKNRKRLWACNALNTSDYDTIEGQSCIDFWLSHKNGRRIVLCPVCHDLLKKSEAVGGHVIVFDGKDNYVCITPMHSDCNTKREKAGPFEVLEADLVRVPEEDEEAILADPDNKKLVTQNRLIIATQNRLNPSIAAKLAKIAHRVVDKGSQGGNAG